MTSGAKERKRILEECSARGLDAAGLRRYAELIAENRGRTNTFDIYDEGYAETCREIREALMALRYANERERPEYMSAILTLSGFGILDAMIEDTISKMRNFCPMNADGYTEILLKYYGYGYEENEYRLKRITKFGKTTAYAMRSGALLSFGIIFSGVTVRDALEALAESSMQRADLAR